MDPGDYMTGTSVNIQNKVQCLGLAMKPCDCNLGDSQPKTTNGRIPQHRRTENPQSFNRGFGADARRREALSGGHF